MHNGSRVAVIILAAGNSTRMGDGVNKQYLCIKDKPVLARTVEVFEYNQYVDKIVLVVNESDIEYCRREIVEKFKFEKVVKVVGGGKERRESCQNGIKALLTDNDEDRAGTEMVMIHDGARPLVTQEIIDNTIAGISEHGVCCVCVPVKDTIKLSDENKHITGTTIRSRTYAAQTPQGFRMEILREIYNKEVLTDATDDSQIAEYYGYLPKIIDGSYENIKITTKEDIYLAENIILNRGY